MRRLFRRAWLLFGVSALAVVAALGAPAGAQQSTEDPTAVLSPNPATPGADVEVIGSGWRPLSLISSVICGNDALNGSVDCDLEAAVVSQTFEVGTFRTRLPVRLPPRPCPCVVRITELDTSRVRDVPLDILGAQLAVPTSDAPMTSGQVTITVVDAWVGSVNDIASWFGAPAPRVLVVRVRNDGDRLIPAALLTAVFGKNGDPSDTIASAGSDRSPTRRGPRDPGPLRSPESRLRRLRRRRRGRDRR